MEGFDLGILSALACALACNSSPVHAELAKVVVDIESNIAPKVTRNGSGQERNLEAQSGLGWDPNPANAHDGGPCPALEICESEEGSAYHACGMLGAQMEVNERNKERNTHTDENWAGNSPFLNVRRRRNTG